MPPAHGAFSRKFLTGDCYLSPAFRPGAVTEAFPALCFYARLARGPLGWLCRMAAKGLCDDAAWVRASAAAAETLESVGGRFDISGMDNIDAAGPCVFVANHMSTLETFVLPAIIRPRRPVTFVVKRSLTTMPFFGAVMRSRDPIVVDRANPRDDLAAVLEGGCARLARGVSIIVFPQHTRSRHFDERLFNSIGVKLARKARVPVVPVALKTDAWGTGEKIKELGPIRPDLPARFAFGAPLPADGGGKETHKAVCRYIREHVRLWERRDGVNEG